MSTEPKYIEPIVDPTSGHIDVHAQAQNSNATSVKEALIQLSQQPSSPPGSPSPSPSDLAHSITPSTDSFGLLLPEDAGPTTGVKTDLQETHIHVVELETPITSSPTLGEHQAPRLGLDAIGENPQRVSLTPSPSRAELIPEGRGHDSDLSDDPETLSASVVTPLPPADLDLITHSPPTTINIDEVNKATEIPKNLELQRALEVTKKLIFQKSLSPFERGLSLKRVRLLE